MYVCAVDGSPEGLVDLEQRRRNSLLHLDYDFDSRFVRINFCFTVSFSTARLVAFAVCINGAQLVSVSFVPSHFRFSDVSSFFFLHCACQSIICICIVKSIFGCVISQIVTHFLSVIFIYIYFLQ